MKLIECKSIKFSCMNAIIFLIVLSNIEFYVHAANSRHEILNDLPVKNDLETYISALERVTKFTLDHKELIDVNFAFGLFLVNVNLRKSLNCTKKYYLPNKSASRLHKIISNNDKLSQFFTSMVEQTKDEKFQRFLIITTMFSNGISWNIEKFNEELLKKTKFNSRRQLINSYGMMMDYQRKVDGITNTSLPYVSDNCLSFLAENPVHNGEHPVQCRLPKDCVRMLSHGDDYGYALSHRLLFLVNARYARACTVFGDKEDRNYTDELCVKMYDEVEYIAANGYKTFDLMMEQMALCSLLGHAQFIRRSWVTGLLQYQTPYGCFGASKYNENALPPVKYVRRAWKISKADQNVMDGACNTHVTAVSATVLAASIRYILETFY